MLAYTDLSYNLTEAEAENIETSKIMCIYNDFDLGIIWMED